MALGLHPIRGGVFREPVEIDPVHVLRSGAFRVGVQAWKISGGVFVKEWESPLYPPTGVTAEAQNPSTIRFGYIGSPSLAVESYKAYYRAGASMGGSKAAADGSVDLGLSNPVDVAIFAEGTLYYVAICAVRFGVESGLSVETSELMPVAVPSGPPSWKPGFPRDKATTDQDTELQLTAATDATSHDVYFRVGSNMGGDPVANGTYLGNFSDAEIVTAILTHAHGQPHGTSIFYNARGRNDGGPGPFMAADAEVVTQFRVPGAPTGVSASMDFGTLVATITFSAGSPANQTHFTVREYYRACGSGGAYTTGTVWNSSSPATRAVLEGREYYYTVEAVGAAGSSAPVASASIFIGEAPLAPSWETGFPDKNDAEPTGALDLAWTGSAASWNIRYRSVGGSYPPTPQVQGYTGAHSPASPYVLDGLIDGVTWEVQVQAVDPCAGPGEWSSTGTASTDTAPPDTAPEDFTAVPTQATDDKVDLDVGMGVFDATGYDFQRAPDVSGSPGTWSTIASNDLDGEYQDTGRSPNTKYWYRAAGRNAGGLGPWSDPVAATTHRQAPNIELAARNTANCPELRVDVTVSHANDASNARSEAFDVRTWDGSSYTNHAAQTAGTTDFQLVISTATTHVETKYQSESTWSSRTIIGLVCPF